MTSLTRHSCGFAAYQCDPSTCESRCFTSSLAEINAKTTRQMRVVSIQTIALAAVSFIVIFTAGYWGLSRAERAYQIERV